MATFAGHSLIPRAWFTDFENFCLGDDDSNEAIDKCNDVFSKIEKATTNLDVYGVDFAVCPEDPLNTSNSNDKLKQRNNNYKNK